MFSLSSFSDVIVTDTEFSTHPEGEVIKPLCVCAQGIQSGRTVRYWVGQEEGETPPPFFLPGCDSLLVAYVAQAELKTFLALGWPLPRFVLDLYYLFRRMTNGYPVKRGLVDCAQMLNVPLPYSTERKKEMQMKAANGERFDRDEQEALLSYCTDDVKLTLDVFRALCPDHPGLWKEALLYGEYCKVIAKEEHKGLPVDKPRIDRLLKALPEMVRYLVKTIPSEIRFYNEGGQFSETAFTEYLIHNGIPWLPAKRVKKKRANFFDPNPPQLPSRLRAATDAESLKELVKIYPQFKELADVRYFIERMGIPFLPIGQDGRCRASLWPASSDTMRNQPSSTKFLLGQPKWTRNFLKPPPGHSIIEIDVAQEEYHIAAILSGDRNMLADYESGDVYLSLATRIGLLLPGVSDGEREEARNRAKIIALGIQYGMSALGMAKLLNIPMVWAEHYLTQLRCRYSAFFEWSDRTVTQAALTGIQVNHYGWVRGNTRDVNPRSLRNFPIQSTGSGILQRVCIHADKEDIQLIGTAHDSFLAETSIEDAEMVAAHLQEIIGDVTFKTLGRRFRTGEPKIVNYPDHYSKANPMWDKVQEIYQAVTGEPL